MKSKKIYDFIGGRFLVQEDVFSSWKLIVFVVFLILILISSSHSVDKKVMEISKLHNQVKEKREEFVDLRTISMREKLETTIKKKVKDVGLLAPNTPPFVIIAKK